MQGFCTFDTAVEMPLRLTIALAALMATQAGELPIWIPLALVSAAAAAGLLANAGSTPLGPKR